MVPAVAGSELNEVDPTGPPAQTTEFSRPRRFSSLQCQPQRDEVSRLRASSGRSKTQQHQEALGLPNIGNSCFLNASLQCLYSLPCFCSDITGQEDLWSPRRRTKLKLLRYLGELYKSRQGEGSYKGKRRLLWSIKSSLAEFNEEYEHITEQDAHEFLLLLFMKMKMEGETLQEISTSPSYICPVQNFEFRLQCVRTCTSCGDKVFQEEEQNHLSLDLHPSLIAGLQFYFKPSELECTCRQCSGCQTTAVRHFLTLPRVLLLHMKRFHHDGARLRKVTDAVSVPPWLSLASLVGEQGAAAGIDPLRSSYGEGEIASGAKPSANMAAVDHLDSAGDRDRGLQEVHGKDHSNQSTYRLSGMVSHLGESINTGHYVSDVAREDGAGWLTLNDARVTPAETPVLRTREKTAYMLFYVLSGAEEGSHVPLAQNQEPSGAERD
ncbi:ubiquitin carboxyl-terminal hydrolase 37-like isoform X2 [Gadus morhua]|uniref:ubiquitin carboxyl-terminal hydrolase 37-like isoform X2 n=2 Tax=Gadus morhua TaxID=8049 RepID=UPI0011B778C8|nr:ubiquitin carboxyl-terminal hydrolase 37-like isoform X2 [Gadus morhua]